MDGHRGMGRWVTMRRFACGMVATLLCSVLLGTGGFASAAGPGPVFSNIKASATEVAAGDTVYLTTRLTSTADVLGNPTVSYHFPDGTPGPTVAFSRVGGSLRDGEWQATLPLSPSLPAGPYYVAELRAADVAGNLTIVGPDESVVHAADLTVTSVTQSPIFAVAGDGSSDLSATKDTPPSRPAFCNGGSSPGLTFRWAALFVDSTKPDYTQTWNNRNSYSNDYHPSLRPSDSFYILAFVTDCTQGANENANSHALFEYRSTTGSQRTDGPSPSFQRVAGNQFEGLYVAKVTLYGHHPCDCNQIRLKRLYMGDYAGGHTFTVSHYGWVNNTWSNYRRS